MPDTETPMPTINSFYDNETSTEYAVEDTVARERADAAQETAEEALAAAGEASGEVFETTPAWVAHRNTYRGQYLGDSYTDEQKAMVAAGTFDDLYIGDYWTIGNFDWIIADINYWLNTGDQPEHQGCTTPHLAIVPKKHLYTAKMNDSNVTTGGYLNSRMYTQNLANAKTIIYTAFGENNILNHRELFTNAVTNGVSSAGTWIDSKVDLMNQIMVYGSMILPSSPASNVVPYNYTIDKTQLSLFRLRPDLITISEESCWLRDVVSSAAFAYVTWLGHASNTTASSVLGVRPVFGLIG